MYHHIRKNIKYGGILLLLGVLFALSAACNTSSPNLQIIQTSDYHISVSKAWKSTQEGQNNNSAPELHFSNNGQLIGGIQVLRYDPKEPLESQSLFGNHVSRVLRTEDLTGTTIPAKQVFFERSWQENNQSFISYELHVYYMPGSKVSKYGHEITYDLYLDTGKIDTQKNPDLTELDAKQAKEKIWKITNTWFWILCFAVYWINVLCQNANRSSIRIFCCLKHLHCYHDIQVDII